MLLPINVCLERIRLLFTLSALFQPANSSASGILAYTSMNTTFRVSRSWNEVSHEVVFLKNLSGDSILPEGSNREKHRIKEALLIVSRTNPDIYNKLKAAGEIFTIQMIDSLSPKPEDPNVGNIINMADGAYVQTDKSGDFGVTFKEHNALRMYLPDTGFVFWRGGRNNGEPDSVSISEEEANNAIYLKDLEINLLTGMGKKMLAKVLAHELGHAEYVLRHKAKAKFYCEHPLPDDANTDGHDKGNPNGQAAEAAERQFLREYKNVKRTLKQEQKKNHYG
jgi:hypothetical protein